MENNTYFFTATILNWNKILREDKYKDIIVNSLQFLTNENRIKVFGFVIMPNHIHLIWKILDGHTLPEVQRDFLKFTAQQIKLEIKNISPDKLKDFKVNAKDREFQIWERNALATELITEAVLIQKLNYIHCNPIQERWNLCKDFQDYKYSSAGFYYKGESEWTFLTNYREE
ncbi:MAG: transposase [Ignavibacteriae bacterium]|nr:transposase [Ignavibacteriota bacterium]